MHSRTRGFTLIELLVVVGIISLLISIILPAFSHFRIMSKRTACMANLRSISQLLEIYLNDNRDYWPYASRMISIEEDPNRRAISEVVLGGVSKGSREVFKCPADRITAEPELLNETYYEHEKTSYEWDFTTWINGEKRGKEFDDWIVTAGNPRPSPSDVPILNDFECFHGGATEAQSLVILYADMHVTADKEPVDPEEWPSVE